MPAEYRKERKKWGYRFYRQGVPYKQFKWDTKAEAKKAERDRIRELEENPPPPPTALASVVSWYLIDGAAPELERSRHRLDALHWNMKKFILPHFGAATLVGDIKSEQVNDFVRKHRRAGRKPKTVKNLFTDLNALLNYAVQKGLLTANPVQKANRKLIGNIKPNKTPLNMDEILMTLSVLADSTRVHLKERVYVLFGIMLGARMDEGNRATWTDIDWSRRTIRVRGTKTEVSDAVLSIPPALFSELMELHRQREDSELIFPGESAQTRGKKIYSRRRLFEKIRKLVLERYARKIHLTPKDLRDIYASDVAANTKNPETLMKMMRHTSLTTTTKYLRGVDERMKQAAEGIGQQWMDALLEGGQNLRADILSARNSALKTGERGSLLANSCPERGSLGAVLGGGLSVKNPPKTTQNDVSTNLQQSVKSQVTPRPVRERLGGGGQTRTVDSADMSRVL